MTIGKESRLPIGKRAVIRNIWWTGRVFTKKHEGKFTVDNLQALADTDLWHTGISGLSQACRGEGHTPEYAIRDAINRNEEQVRLLQQALAELHAALQQCIISKETSK